MIDIEFDDKHAVQVMARLIGACEHRAPLMRTISETMFSAVEENFARQGRPAWQGLAPATIAQRREHGYWPGKILQRSGQLAASVVPAYDNDSAQVGTNKRYAAIQQLGGKAGRGRKVTLPARPFLSLTEIDHEDIIEDVADYLRRVVR